MGRKITELTDEEFRLWVQKKLKKLEDLIDESWQKINDFDENTRGLADEARDHADRAQRAVRRLKNEWDDHGHPHRHPQHQHKVVAGEEWTEYEHRTPIRDSD